MTGRRKHRKAGDNRTTSQMGYGYAHQKLRAEWRKVIDAAGGTCTSVICLEPSRYIAPGSPFDLGHTADRSAYEGPQHVRCNRADGARRKREAAATRPRKRGAVRTKGRYMRRALNPLRRVVGHAIWTAIATKRGGWSRSLRDEQVSESAPLILSLSSVEACHAKDVPMDENDRIMARIEAAGQMLSELKPCIHCHQTFEGLGHSDAGQLPRAVSVLHEADCPVESEFRDMPAVEYRFDG